jgi:hypothetical protein
MVTRTEAVARISDAIGWRAVGHNKEDAIIRRLQEAQRMLEKGKTLPRFLLEEDYEVTLAQGDHSIPLPTGFLKFFDENLLHYTSTDTNLATYLSPMDYITAVKNVEAQQRPDEIAITTRAPEVFVLRKNTIDFIATANTDYIIHFDYYKAADLLTADIENVWLQYASDWLIGEAGVRIAADLRDVDAVQLFNQMRNEGRQAVFNDIIESELQSSPIVIGSQN